MRVLLSLMLCMAGARAAVPEPAGYWQGPAGGDVPASIVGGQVIHTAALAKLLDHQAVILLDVAIAPRRPANMAAGAVWLPLAHQDIPGSLWIPEAGQAASSPAMDASLRQRLATSGRHASAAPIVVYCHPRCWRSWNAAKRLIGYGYNAVYWYPDGIEGWVAAGHSVTAAKPEGPQGEGAG